MAIHAGHPSAAVRSERMCETALLCMSWKTLSSVSSTVTAVTLAEDPLPPAPHRFLAEGLWPCMSGQGLLPSLGIQRSAKSSGQSSQDLTSAQTVPNQPPSKACLQKASFKHVTMLSWEAIVTPLSPGPLLFLPQSPGG